MFEVGQQVTVITDKGIGYNCYVLARASGDNGIKAYKVSSDEGGMGQMGQWHKAADIFVIDPDTTAPMAMPDSLEGIVDNTTVVLQAADRGIN